MEELCECDVMWPEYHATAQICTDARQEKEQMKASRSPASAPVSIPAPKRSSSSFGQETWIDDEAAELVPPHVLVSRSRSGEKEVFSGRTLRGRDLKRVRDSVHRMTGYIEGC